MHADSLHTRSARWPVIVQKQNIEQLIASLQVSQALCDYEYMRLEGRDLI